MCGRRGEVVPDRDVAGRTSPFDRTKGATKHMNANGFSAVFSELMRSDLMKGAKLPFDDATEGEVGPLVKRGARHLPAPFQTAYADHLEVRLDNVLARVGDDLGMVETIAGAVYQHAPVPNAPTRITSLHRFLAVVSNLYRSFL